MQDLCWRQNKHSKHIDKKSTFTNVFDIARLDMSYMNVHMSFLKSLKKNIEEKLFSFLLINVFVRGGETNHAVYALYADGRRPEQLRICYLYCACYFGSTKAKYLKTVND